MKIVVLIALVFAIAATVVAIVRNKRGHNHAWVALVLVWLLSSGLGLWGTLRPQRTAPKPAATAPAKSTSTACAEAVRAMEQACGVEPAPDRSP